MDAHYENWAREPSIIVGFEYALGPTTSCWFCFCTVGLAAGGGFLGIQDDVARILAILRKYLSPDAVDAIRQQVIPSCGTVHR